MASVSTSRSSSPAAVVTRASSKDVITTSFVPARVSSLRSAIFWMLSGRVIYNLSQFGVLAALVNICSTSAAGHFVLGLAVTAPVVMFCNLQLRLVLATDVRHEVPFADYLAVRNLMAVVALGLILALSMCAESRQVAVIIGAVGVSKLIESISDIHYGRLQRANRTNVVSRSLFIRGLTSFALATMACLAFESVMGVGIALSLGGLAVLLLHDVPASTGLNHERQYESCRDRPADRRERVLKLVWRGLPLAVGSALMSLEANAPRYVVAAHFDANLLAVVGVMTYALAAGQTLVTALCYPAVPRLAAHYAEGRTRAFLRLLGKLFVLGGFAALVAFAAATLFGRQLLLVVMGEDFAAHSTLFVLTVAAGGIQVIQHILLNALRAMRHFRIVSLVQLAGLITTAALCVALTHLAGVNGVGWALILSFSSGTLLCSALIYLSMRGRSEHAGRNPY
ncbi:MAG TPA: lipopolysaccharide biosynthesis protein [Lacipirellulaceae bacterium]